MQLRFVVKKVGIPDTKKFEYRVYDKLRGSFPYQTKDLGKVTQDHATDKLAQDEADRLTEQFGGMPEHKAKKKAAAVASSSGAGDDDE